MVVLELCPLCKGKAAIAIQQNCRLPEYDASVYCTSCGCTVRKKIILPEWTKNKLQEVELRIAEIWNRRA